jgi:hypothetical protein
MIERFLVGIEFTTGVLTEGNFLDVNTLSGTLRRTQVRLFSLDSTCNERPGCVEKV